MYYPYSEKKALISCAVTAQLICVFVVAYAKSRFSHNEVQLCLQNDQIRFETVTRASQNVCDFIGQFQEVYYKEQTTNQLVELISFAYDMTHILSKKILHRWGFGLILSWPGVVAFYVIYRCLQKSFCNNLMHSKLKSTVLLRNCELLKRLGVTPQK